MADFIIRPIKSYATVDVLIFKRGDAFKVESVDVDGVNGTTKDGNHYCVPMEVFVRTFTANPDDIQKMREAEWKTMGYDPKKKKEAK